MRRALRSPTAGALPFSGGGFFFFFGVYVALTPRVGGALGRPDFCCMDKALRVEVVEKAAVDAGF